jgi:hypothetical protein
LYVRKFEEETPHMPEFELIFSTAPLTSALEDRLLETFDCTIATHDDLTLVTLTATGHEVPMVARATYMEMESLGVQALRLEPDLVSRPNIAKRACVTPQAVGLWTSRRRRMANPFPPPFTLAGGGLWLWAEVNEWLTARGKAHDDIHFPSKEDLDHFNSWLVNLRRAGAPQFVLVPNYGPPPATEPISIEGWAQLRKLA